MSEVSYNILNFDEKISSKSFQNIIEKFDSNGIDTSRVKISEEQLKVFISILFVYGYHYDTIDTDNRTLFLKAVTEEKFPLFDIPKNFCLHLLNNLDSTALAELNSLQKVAYDFSNPLSNNRLVDFVEMDLIDVTESHRKWEYGKFISEKMFSSIFDNTKWGKTIKSLETEPQKTKKFLEDFDKQIIKKGENLSSSEMAFLQRIVKAKINSKKGNIVDYLLIGSIFQKNIISLSRNIEKLESVMDKSLNASKFMQKGKGGQHL